MDKALSSQLIPTKPLVRWVGGKRKLLSKILPFVPQKFGTYYEPFFGGGALYFALAPKAAVLGDINEELVNFLKVVKESPEELLRSLRQNTNTKAAYYAMRETRPTSAVGKAARFQYLVNLAFGGVFRVNKLGDFNVPYSHERNRGFFDEDRIKAASALLQTAEIQCADFTETVASAKAGDFVYFDPPYTVAHDNNGFLEYNESIFQWQDQEKLAALVKTLARQGVKVLVSNANHSSVRALYDEKHIQNIDRKSTVSASSDFRGDVKEILVVYN